jgi:dienelactone hydrolase
MFAGRSLAAAFLLFAAAGCSIEEIRGPDSTYAGPRPLAADLAARFAYQPMGIEPAIERVEESDTFERLRGSYAAPCPVTGEEKKVVFEFWRTKVAPGPRPAILCLPILAGRYPECEHLGAFFARNGFQAFFVHREENLLAFENEPRDLETIMRRSVVNIRRTLDWISRRPDVDGERIGLVGISLGAIGGSIVAAVEPRIKRSILIMGGGDLAEIFWRSREGPVRAWRSNHRRRWEVHDVEGFRAEFEKGYRSDPLLFAPSVDARTVLQFIARYDDRVPTENQWRLWEALGRPTAYAVPTGHYSAILFVGFAEKKALAFFREAFERPVAPAPSAVAKGK